MAGSTNKSWWQYSSWVKNVARNSRITNPTATDPNVFALAYIRILLKAMCDPMLKGTASFDDCTRPWLYDKFLRCSVNANYQCDIDTEPTHVLIKMLEVVGRDFKKIPISDDAGAAHTDETAVAGLVIILTSPRFVGAGSYFGGVVGDYKNFPYS